MPAWSSPKGTTSNFAHINKYFCCTCSIVRAPTENGEGKKVLKCLGSLRK